jgi:hypothetical protein
VPSQPILPPLPVFPRKKKKIEIIGECGTACRQQISLFEVVHFVFDDWFSLDMNAFQAIMTIDGFQTSSVFFLGLIGCLAQRRAPSGDQFFPPSFSLSFFFTLLRLIACEFHLPPAVWWHAGVCSVLLVYFCFGRFCFFLPRGRTAAFVFCLFPARARLVWHAGCTPGNPCCVWLATSRCWERSPDLCCAGL